MCPMRPPTEQQKDSYFFPYLGDSKTILMVGFVLKKVQTFLAFWYKSKQDIQQYTHKLQHPNIATYSEITTFSRNQTKLQVFFKLQLLRSCNVLLSTEVL